MHLTRLHKALLLGGILLLALPAAQAKRPGEEDGYRKEQAQPMGRQFRDAGRDDGSRYRDERRYEDLPRTEPRGFSYDPRGMDYGARPQPRGKSLSDAVSEAEHRTGGRVLSAEPREENGEFYYRVKVLTPDGRVQILYLDAR